jgi:hypothetical protein
MWEKVKAAFDVICLALCVLIAIPILLLAGVLILTEKLFRRACGVS